MREIEAKQLKKPANGCSNEVAATAALLSLSASPATAPAQRFKRAGVVAFITPNGLTVICFPFWARVVKHAQRLRQQGTSPAQVAAYLTRKSRELEAQFGWLKKLWAARLQRVLKRLALHRGVTQRWDGKEANLLLPEAPYFLAALKMPIKECRSPPDFECPADALLFVASLFVAPSVPRAQRAPTFALPAWRGDEWAAV
jgi:hypothetical protein